VVNEALDLGSDLVIRYQWFTKESLGHPAKLHLGLLQWLIDRYTTPGETVCDPMAGIGSILLAATQQRNVIAREIEPRWLTMCHENAAHIHRQAGLLAGTIDVGQADAREPWGYQADHIIFSPPYACSVASTPTAKGMTSHQIRARLAKLGGYDKAWDRLLRAYDQGQGGVVAAYVMHYGQHSAQIGHWRGDRYWQAMTQVYAQAAAALRPGGSMILVIKDHIRKGQRIRIADETAARCEALGFSLHARHTRRVWPLSLWQRRRKERGEPIVEEEDVLVFRGVL
jgi:DNA modification methylase